MTGSRTSIKTAVRDSGNGRRPVPSPAGRLTARDGQSLVESCLVMAMICLLFLGLFQVSQLFAAKEVLAHAAARAARAKTVGFRSWMTDKAVLVATIPNAGRITEPAFVNDDQNLRTLVANSTSPGELWDTLLRVTPSSLQYNLEAARIPEFMASRDSYEARYILDYDRWNTIHQSSFMADDPADSNLTFTISVSQDYPLSVPGRMHRAFYAADSVRLVGESTLEKHYPLYLDPSPAYY